MDENENDQYGTTTVQSSSTATFETFLGLSKVRERKRLDIVLRTHQISTRGGKSSKAVQTVVVQTQTAFKSEFRGKPSRFEMIKWILTRCSQPTKEVGYGFLDIQVSAAGQEYYNLSPLQIKYAGIVDLRRTGPPEYSDVKGTIAVYECCRLQNLITNACGKDILTIEMINKANPNRDKSMCPTLKEVANVQYTPLLLKPEPAMRGSLICMQESSGMYLIETTWKNKPLARRLKISKVSKTAEHM